MPTYWECCESSAPAFRLHRRSPVSVSSGRSSSCRGGAVPADGSRTLFQCAASPGWFCWGPDRRRHLDAALGPASCCRKTAAAELRSPPPGSPLPTAQRPLWCRPLLFPSEELPAFGSACVWSRSCAQREVCGNRGSRQDLAERVRLQLRNVASFW